MGYHFTTLDIFVLFEMMTFKTHLIPSLSYEGAFSKEMFNPLMKEKLGPGRWKFSFEEESVNF